MAVIGYLGCTSARYVFRGFLSGGPALERRTGIGRVGKEDQERGLKVFDLES